MVSCVAINWQRQNKVKENRLDSFPSFVYLAVDARIGLDHLENLGDADLGQQALDKLAEKRIVGNFLGRLAQNALHVANVVLLIRVQQLRHRLDRSVIAHVSHLAKPPQSLAAQRIKTPTTDCKPPCCQTD